MTCTRDTTKNNTALTVFMRKYSANKVPVKHWGKRRHDGEKYKPETGRIITGSFSFV